MFFSRELVRNMIYFSCAFLFLGSVSVVVYQHFFPKIIFVSRLSEAWYPRDKKDLLATIDVLFSRVSEFSQTNDRQEAPWMIIVPHAGYAYSGMVAAAGYSLLLGADAKKYKRVLLIAPSHYVDFYGLAIPEFTHYQSPLGESIVDVDAVELIKDACDIEAGQLVFHREHAIDVQIPWIQSVLPEAKILPLIIGRVTNHEMVHHLAQVLLKVFDEQTLVVVSSDLLHYGKNFNCCPFGTELSAQGKVGALENELISAIQSLNVFKFDDVVTSTQAAICGKNAIKLALELAVLSWVQDGEHVQRLSQVSNAQLLAQQSSFAVRQQAGEKLDELEHVGYAAIAAWRKNSSVT